MSIETIELWHKRARPEPTEREFNTQLGCHLEEVAEMLATVSFRMNKTLLDEIEDKFHTDSLFAALQVIDLVAVWLKTGQLTASITDRKAFLDSLADQIVTATGAGYCAGMHIAHAVRRVDQSNWTKYVDGQPVFDANGKIAKPDSYQPPNLEGLY